MRYSGGIECGTAVYRVERQYTVWNGVISGPFYRGIPVVYRGKPLSFSTRVRNFQGAYGKDDSYRWDAMYTPYTTTLSFPLGTAMVCEGKAVCVLKGVATWTPTVGNLLVYTWQALF